ncbi:MAG TPA: Hsp33 family molecular chaperone HslO, partial [Thermoanaerobaculia bacterium]|nr:Hsp33 family molecular chaperone HslO [Thermoanaerobaculia bacterium]
APPLSTIIEKMPIEDVVAQVLHGLDYKQLDPSFNVPLEYRCPCTRERALAPLALFTDDELESMINEGGQEVTCQFCGRKYAFTTDELRATLRQKHA